MNIEIDKQKKIKSLEARMNVIQLRYAVFLNEKKTQQWNYLKPK
jgi:hypothetical protein